MRSNEQAPLGTDDPAAPLFPASLLRAFWTRLTAKRPLRPRGNEAIRGIRGEWRKAERLIARMEPPAPSLDAPAKRFDELCASLTGDIACLRAPLPRDAVRGAGPREIADHRLRARALLKDAEEQLDAMEEWSRQAGEAADMWERLAMRAVEAGSDELAWEALDRRKELVILHRTLAREVGAGRAVLAQMGAALEQIAPACEEHPPRSE